MIRVTASSQFSNFANRIGFVTREDFQGDSFWVPVVFEGSHGFMARRFLMSI